jgi:hypothetical protein
MTKSNIYYKEYIYESIVVYLSCIAAENDESFC